MLVLPRLANLRSMNKSIGRVQLRKAPLEIAPLEIVPLQRFCREQRCDFIHLSPNQTYNHFIEQSYLLCIDSLYVADDFPASRRPIYY